MKENKKYLFLNVNLNERLTGVEHSSLLRAKLFHKHLGITPYIVTTQYNNHLASIRKGLIENNLLDKEIPIINMYEYFQETNKVNSVNKQIKNEEWTYEKVPKTKDYRVYHNDNFLMYQKRFNNTGNLNYINYFSKGKKVKRDKYDGKGYLSVSQILAYESEKISTELFYRTDGTTCMIKHYYYKNKKRNLGTISLLDKNNNITNVFHKESELVAYWLNELLEKDTKYFCFVDKNRIYYQPLKDLNLENVYLIPNIHSLHTRDYKNVFTSNINSNYLDIFADVTNPDAIVILTEKQKDDIEKRFGIKGNYHVIPHAMEKLPYPVPFIQRDRNKVIALSRFSEEKHLDKMIEIFSKVVNRIPSAILEIYGYGKEKKNLEKLIKELNMEENIFLKPYVNDVSKLYESASLSLLTSRVEGFSLTILESLAHGCPVISFDIKYGPSDMIESGKNGYLVKHDDQDTFANKIIKVLQNHSLNERLSDNAYELIHKFRAEEIAKKWNDLLESVKNK